MTSINKLSALFSMIETIGDGPSSWPTRYRKVFLYLLPVTLPLYAAVLSLIMLSLLAMWIILAPVIWVLSVWEGEA